MRQVWPDLPEVIWAKLLARHACRQLNGKAMLDWDGPGALYQLVDHGWSDGHDSGERRLRTKRNASLLNRGFVGVHGFNVALLHE